VLQAKQRATLGGPVFFSGEEALAEVAKKAGQWNWALVGPDPVNLPLSAGGAGGVEEMRDSIKNHAHSFGLLRMDFVGSNDGEVVRSVLLCVHTSHADGFNIRERNKASSKRDEVMNRLEKFGKISMRIHFASEEDCNFEHVIGKLNLLTHWGIDAAIINAEHLQRTNSQLSGGHSEQGRLSGIKVHGAGRVEAGVPRCGLDDPIKKTARIKKKPEVTAIAEADKESDSEEEKKEAEPLVADASAGGGEKRRVKFRSSIPSLLSDGPEKCPKVSDAEDSLDETSSDEADFTTKRPLLILAVTPQRSEACDAEFKEAKQRRKVPRFNRGEAVEVWSMKYNRWVRDAEVADMVTESCERDGMKLRAGSVKVVYKNQGRFKWIPPQLVVDHLRPSRRPIAPDAKFGQLHKETHGDDTVWQPVHVEVNQGFMQWWASEEAARRGKKPICAAFLFCMNLFCEGSLIKIRTDATGGAIHVFRALAEEDAQAWEEALWEHAGFCGDVTEGDKSPQQSPR